MDVPAFEPLDFRADHSQVTETESTMGVGIEEFAPPPCGIADLEGHYKGKIAQLIDHHRGGTQ